MTTSAPPAVPVRRRAGGPRDAARAAVSAPLHEAPPLTHLLAITDDTGTIQHATFDVPNRSTGYCTDDVARALIVAIRAGGAVAVLRPKALELARTSLAFLHHAQRADGRFRNFMSYERTWLEELGSEDANGRAIWALGVAVRSAPSFGFRALAGEIFDRAIPATRNFVHLRSHAFAVLGLVEASLANDEMPAPDAVRRLRLHDAVRAGAERLLEAYRAFATESWTWFEDVITYDNARLCEALLRAGIVLEDAAMLAAGAATLAFYERATVVGGVFIPVGNDGWYPRGGTSAAFGQQPLEAAALVDAAFAGAAAAAAHPQHVPVSVAAYEALARIGLAWFHGANCLGRSLVSNAGACADGLEASGISMNAGAESTLAYLAAAYAVAGRPER